MRCLWRLAAVTRPHHEGPEAQSERMPQYLQRPQGQTRRQRPEIPLRCARPRASWQYLAPCDVEPAAELPRDRECRPEMPPACRAWVLMALPSPPNALPLGALRRAQPRAGWTTRAEPAAGVRSLSPVAAAAPLRAHCCSPTPLTTAATDHDLALRFPSTASQFVSEAGEVPRVKPPAILADPSAAFASAQPHAEYLSPSSAARIATASGCSLVPW